MLGLTPSAAEIPAFAPPVAERRFRATAPVPAGPCPQSCARWARGEGLGLGDAVALLMHDTGEAEALRIGLGRAGVRTVRLDAEAREAALAAALAASGASTVVADTALAGAYAGVMGRLATYPAVWWNGPGADFARLDLALAEAGAP